MLKEVVKFNSKMLKGLPEKVLSLSLDRAFKAAKMKFKINGGLRLLSR